VTDLHALPTLDDLAAHPERAAELPPETVAALHYRAVRVLMALEAPLLARSGRVDRAAEPNGSDRFLDAEQVGVLIGKSKSWVEKHPEELPKRRRVGGEGKWSEREIQQWMKHRETWEKQ
jgi:predicted DNA-binding transcriptional regulator AlpA